MPYLSAKLSGAPSADTTRRVAGALADLTVEVLGKRRELTSVAVELVPSEQWFAGGASVASQHLHTFFLDIKVTEGTNTKDEKASFVSEAFTALEAILGKLHPASYVVIDEVRADAWGYGGATQEHRYITGRAP